MSMLADLRSLLLADPVVSDLVGTRISWSTIPQGSARPAIVMHLISAPIDYHLGGAGGPAQSRVQIDCQAAQPFSNALHVGEAVTAAISGYAGTFGTTRFAGIFQDSAQDLSEVAAAEQQISVYSLDVIVHHQQE
jgi:hypothetical protein